MSSLYLLRSGSIRRRKVSKYSEDIKTDLEALEEEREVNIVMT
jgi:hypothetical protein